jgi:hypothetical protein
VSFPRLGGDWTEEDRWSGWLKFQCKYFTGALVLDLFYQGVRGERKMGSAVSLISM